MMTVCGKMQLIKRDCVHLLPTNRYKPDRMAQTENKKKRLRGSRAAGPECVMKPASIEAIIY